VQFTESSPTSARTAICALALSLIVDSRNPTALVVGEMRGVGCNSQSLEYATSMKLTAQVKLAINSSQRETLLHTMETANSACNEISDTAWKTGAFRQYDLHRECYKTIRDKFPLSAQVVVRCIGKVSDSYKKDKKTKRNFKKRGAVTYDERILRWYDNSVSIWTMNGRQKIPFGVGDHHKKLLQFQRGETNLVYMDGNFYLFTTCEIEEPEQLKTTGWLGVDLGIKNIATDSDGNKYSGGHVNGLRKRHAKLRRRLQNKGTKSAKRLLKTRKRKEARMAKDINHCIAKRLVRLAQDTLRGISLENLTGIRERITVRRSQRRAHHSWAFYDLAQKILYKAALVGVPILFVDPRDTSRTCQRCGHCEKGNRKDQSTFKCLSCGFSANADDNAARNISDKASRASVNKPYVATFGLATSLSL